MSDTVVALENVWVRYNGNIILEDITLTISREEIVSIVGPNGSGKTTLLKAIMGFKEPFRGGIEVLGRSPAKIKKSGLIGYLPQGSQYDTQFPVNVFDVVAMARYSRKYLLEGLNRRDHSMIDESLEKVEMSDFKGHHFGSLSGGQKQRVLIARALAAHPEILILDEPSTGLDSVAQDNFYAMLLRLRDDESLTIIMVSHDIGSVSTVVDKVACLKKKIHFHGRPSECIPTEALAKVFGKDVYFLKHDKDCETCREGE
jgi:zinc transport system ATP-binding protein